MLNQTVAVTVRILLFRAGPQDFPHSPQLVVLIPALAACAYFLFWTTILPPGPAALISLSGVGSLALVTHSILTARGMANRFQQSYHALLATTAVLALMIILPATVLAPTFKAIIANPDLLKDPDKVQVPRAASYLVNAIEFWAFALYANVFRHATDTRLPVGILIALFAIAGVSLLTMVAATLFAPLVR